MNTRFFFSDSWQTVRRYSLNLTKTFIGLELQTTPFRDLIQPAQSLTFSHNSMMAYCFAFALIDESLYYG